MSSQSMVSDSVRNRMTAVLFLAQSFFSASTIAAFTLSPIIATALSGTEAAAGIPNTLLLIGRAMFAYPLGYFMDRFGRRRALASGYGLSIFGALISVWAVLNSSFIGFVVGAFFLGMSRAAGDQSRFVAAEMFPLTRRAKVIGTLVFAGTVGAIGGPLLVEPSRQWMQSLDLIPNAGPFVVAAVLMLFATLTVATFLRPDPQEISKIVAKEEADQNPDSIENQASRRSIIEIFSAPLVQLALLSMVIGYFVMTFLMVITPLHMSHNDHTEQSISLVIMAHTLGMFGLSWLTGWLIDRFGRVNMIIAGGAVLIMSCILSPLSLRLPILGLGLFMLGLGWNFCFVAGSSLLSDALSAVERAKSQGAAETFVALASGVASFSVGLTFELGDYVLVSFIGLGLSIGLILLAIWLSGHHRQQLNKLPKTATSS